MVDEEAAPELGTIVGVAQEAGIFTTLLAAGEATGLSVPLDSPGDFTMFAPTVDGFAGALETIGLSAEELLADTATLTSILTYHGLLGSVSAEQAIALDGQSVATINGAEIAISVVDGAVVINDSATVIQADVLASNGVIHVIDAVLLPPAWDRDVGIPQRVRRTRPDPSRGRAGPTRGREPAHDHHHRS